jgi:UDP-2-acetamido-2,6-beta-L-arabino-hexul-4-ose reductase
MNKVLVTGSNGFIGKNLLEALGWRNDVEIMAFDQDSDVSALDDYLARADIVFHLAGVNRPERTEEFEEGNAGLTRDILARLERLKRAPLFVLSSSTQASLDNPYGISKRRAEEAVESFAAASGATVRILRLPNVFGKWCRPNYNSVVATFCHNIAHGLPITISDPARELELVYIDDVIRTFVSLMDESGENSTPPRVSVSPTYPVTLGGLVATIQQFRESRKTLRLPDFSDRLTRCLYATYLSYLPEGDFAYGLELKTDARGALAEFVKSDHCGQIFVSRTKPGITRGNHYHHTKTEKFLIVQGEGVIRFRHILGDDVLSYRISGEEFRVVDIPPGYTHSIENVGTSEMVVLFWASEVFNPSTPDTHALKVFDEQA